MYATIEAKTLPKLNLHSSRYHGLDAARAIALMIGILHHGIESFVTYAKSDWVTQDTQSSILLDIVFYISHVFRMQAFFLMSGFFAHMIYHKKGRKEFINNRVKRLVWPFILFWPFLYFADRQLWIWGIQRASHLSYTDAIAHLPAYFVWSNGFPLMHLWFLYFLILFCAGVVLFRPAVTQWLDPGSRIRNRIDRFFHRIFHHWWGSLVIGAFMVLPMLGMRDWFGVDTSASGLIPYWASFVVYGMYFTLGWFLHRQANLMDNFRRFRLANLIMAVILILTLIVVSLALKGHEQDLNMKLMQAIINGIYAFASITAAMAFIGYMLAWFSTPNKKVRYLSDAAYWGYLIHMPIVALMQDLVGPYHWFWGWKLIIILLPASLLIWASYQWLVRNTWMGVLLNGKRQPSI